jgi:hypothetical protein
LDDLKKPKIPFSPNMLGGSVFFFSFNKRL